MTLLITLALGIILGYKNVVKESLEPLTTKLFACVFLLMLAILGAKMFTSQEVTKNIGNIGLLALLFAVCISIFAVGVTMFLLVWLHPKRKGYPINNELNESNSFEIKHALIPVVAIALGSISVLIRPEWTINYDLWINWLLAFLILGIGIEIGRSREELKLIKGIGWSALFVPLGSLLGSLIGSLLVGFILGMSPVISMAIGAGSGFYSVTAPLVTQAAGAKYGALALLANFLRETIMITLVPLVALRFRHVALVAAGGATTMDTTLPVVARSLGADVAMIALVQGIVLTFIVPIIIPIILGM